MRAYKIKPFVKVFLAIVLVFSFATVMAIVAGCRKHDKPTPVPIPKPFSYVHVKGNHIFSPAGKQLFFKIGTWENPFEGRVSERRIKQFMTTMKSFKLNCILLKGNGWLINDDLSKNRHNINVMHRLITDAQSKGIYVILNLFDVWGRGIGSNQFNVDSKRHPINVWDRRHEARATDYIKWVTREFKRHPMLMFEIGNEMEQKHSRSQVEDYKRTARKMLVHFYAIAGKDRPIGVSQKQLWSLPVNVLFSHDPRRVSRPNGRPILINEYAFDTPMWKDSYIRDGRNFQTYLRAFRLALDMDQSGIPAATIIDINAYYLHPSMAIDRVLRALGNIK